MSFPLPPGSTIGILGGGQLGRMLAQAAGRLGFEVAILEPTADSPAARVSGHQVIGAYDDPDALALLANLGGGARLYRAILLEESGKDYVRTARAKGLSGLRVLWGHVLPNAMLPVLTTLGGTLPYLFMGSLVIESFFGLPGLGAYTVEAISAQDFAVVRSMVFIGAALYIASNTLIDILYTVADPRVRLE